MAEGSPFAAAFPPTTAYQSIGDANVAARFTSVDEEYAAIRSETALIDLSGCGLLAIEGPDAGADLSRAFTRELEFLSPETSVIGMLLNDDGYPLDVATVYRTDGGFLLETSVGQGTRTLAHLREVFSGDTQARTVNDEFAMFGFEGPLAKWVCDQILDEPITGLPFQGVRQATVDGVPVTASRTGFTGEFGFKIVGPHEYAVSLWKRAAEFARLSGHEALEIAMIETRQPLFHREVTSETTVMSAGLNWLVDLEKDDFVGRSALLEQRARPQGTVPVCFVSDGPSIKADAPIGADEEILGRVVHVVRSPESGQWHGIARVAADYAASGIVFRVTGTNSVLRTVSAPIRVPTSWGMPFTSRASDDEV